MRILPRPTWVLSVAILLVFGTVLVIDGTVRGSTQTEAPPPAVAGPNGQVPFAVAHGAPVVDVRTSPIRTFAPAKGTIAFTIDGGPDPSRTAEILVALTHFGVPATFFVSGAEVAQHPEAVRSIIASGSEIGIRTFTSQDLESVSDTRLSRELTLTQLALAGAVDQTTYLVRPPYSASVAGLDDAHFALVRRLADRGMVSVFSDVSAAGWTRRTTDDILASVVTPDGAGRIISVDASEGGTAQLASALSRVIPALRDQGYTFATVTKATGLPPAGQKARERDKTIGDGMLVVVAVSTTIVAALGWLLLVAGGLVLLRLALMLVFAIYHSVRRNPKRFRWGPPVTEPVSVIVPAYNEKECIAATVHSLMASEHPIEVIVVDDGSTDETAAIVRALNLPGVRLIRQANGGKPAALNNGIKHARHEIVVMIDGDTVFEPSTIRLLVQPFSRPEVGAVSGNAKVANRKKVVGRWQHIEYVIGFNIDRRIQDLLGCMTTIPGAVGAFRRKALLQAGLVSDDTLAEDTDLTMAICAAGWQIVYEERARAWTEAPTTLQQLWRQRYRWSYGTMQAMWKHRGSVFRSGPAGRMGRVGLLNLALFQVMLPMLAPLIDVFLVYGLVALDPIRTLQLWGAVLGIQILSGLLAFGMERENPVPLLWMPLQQLVYRQMMYAVLIKSMGTALAGVRLRWQKLKRVGDFGGAGAAAGGPVMARRRWAALAVLLLALTGCQTVVPGSPSPSATIVSPVVFAPYVDISVKRPDLAQVAAATGLKHVTLAFGLAGPGGCDPMWGGTVPAADPELGAAVAAFRKAGGDVVVGTGGAVGTYLENACGTADELAGAYAGLLDAVGSQRLDVDIEAPVDATRIATALAQLQRSRGTAVTLTLPIDLAGLTPAGLDLVRKTVAAGVRLTVNGMDMNFRTGGDWGQAMVDAGQATLDQLRGVYPDASEAAQNRSLGLTVMVGRNDAGPVTTVADATKVLEFARSRGLGHVGIWSLGRDRGSCPDDEKPAVDCSGIAQADLEFTRLFGGFAVSPG